MSTNFELIGKGEVPLLLHLPHHATYLPPEFEYGLDATSLQQDLHRLVDHHTQELFAPIVDLGGLCLKNNLCRLFFDPERYADPAQEVMHQVGMGVFYTHSSALQRFRPDDTPEEHQAKCAMFHSPYHARFDEAVDRLLQRFGEVIIVDGHSYPVRCYPFERFPDAARPEIDVGTAGLHSPATWVDDTRAIFETAGFSVGVDVPFAGSIVPTRFWGEPKVRSLMLEVRRDVYLEPEAYERGDVVIVPDKLSRFHEVLRALVQQWLCGWRLHCS